MSKKKKKYYNGFMPMFQEGAFPMPPMPLMPFAPWGMAGNKNSAGEGDDKKKEQKENIKSTVKSVWTQKMDRKKASVDNSREQWKQFFDYMMEMQDTFTASIPDDTPYAQMLPISPKALVERWKEFQIMANEHFVEQADSFADFCIQGQQQFYDMVSTAMENAAARRQAEDESDDSED